MRPRFIRTNLTGFAADVDGLLTGSEFFSYKDLSEGLDARELSPRARSALKQLNVGTYEDLIYRWKSVPTLRNCGLATIEELRRFVVTATGYDPAAPETPST